MNDRLKHDEEGYLTKPFTDQQLDNMLRTYEAESVIERDIPARPNARSLQDMLSEGLGEAIEKEEHDPEILSPWTPLNELIGSFESGAVYVIGGDTSVGKSAVCLNIAIHSAKEGLKVLYFSPEMSEKAIQCRIIGLLADIPSFKLMKSYHHPTDSELHFEIQAAIDTNKSLPLYVDCRPMLRPSKVYQEVGLIEPDMVIVDYIQRLNAENAGAGIEREITDIFNRLVAVARDYNVPVIAVSQYNRMAGPGNANIYSFRGSGAIEQGADVCVQISRPEMVNDEPMEYKGTTLPGYTKLKVTKNRNGPTGTVEMVFKVKTGRYLALAEEKESDANGQRD